MIDQTIKDAVFVVVLSMGISAATTFIISYLSEWFVWYKGSVVNQLQHSFVKKKENEKFLKLRWGVIYIRDGRDSVIPNLSEREKWIARLKNQIIYFKGHNQKKAKIRFYRTLGCQFKCFIELDNPKLSSDDLIDFLKTNGYSNISKNEKKIVIKQFLRKDKVVRRIWFIHEDSERYDIATTPEGFVNNFLYPE